MDEKGYMAERVEDQLNWYDQKSMWNQARYKLFKSVEIAAAAGVPVVIATAEFVGTISFLPSLLRWAGAILGAGVVVLSGIQGICKYQENWVTYRTTAEMLRHEKYFYETDSGPYKGAKEKFSLLVHRVEELISQENTNWRKYINKEESKEETA
ncbi:MAG: DUF4231 domain-containing protein [Planctomycetota bacterium]